MSERLACVDGQMASRGVQAEYREAFSHTGKWRAREAVEVLCQHQYQCDEWLERHRIAVEGVMRISTWMEKVQTDTVTSPTAS
jgi:hypothetical protein